MLEIYRAAFANDQLTGPDAGTDLPTPSVITTDSRKIDGQTWFWPIIGERFNGHEFINQAMAEGAAGFFYDPDHRSLIEEKWLPHGVPCGETTAALQNLAREWRRSLKNLRIAAVTGSSGKTTTKELVSRILEKSGSGYAAQGSFNNEIGVPLSILQLNDSHRYAMLEFGARKPGNIEFLVKIGDPDVASVINVGTAHLGIFGSREKLMATKLEMIGASRSDAKGIVFFDDPVLWREANKLKQDLIGFGENEGATVRRRTDVEAWKNGKFNMQLDYQGQSYRFALAVAHEAYAQNATAAFAMATALGIDPETCAAGLGGFSGMGGRFQVNQRGPWRIIDDAYNANPGSVTAGFQSLARYYNDEPLTLVLGDMLELGDDSPEEHAAIGHAAGQIPGVRRVIAVGPESKPLAAACSSRGVDVTHVDNADDAMASLESLAAEPQTIYLKASNGIGLQRVVEQLKERGASL